MELKLNPFKMDLAKVKIKSITLSKNIASEKDTKRSLAGLNQITTLEEIQTVKDNAAYQSEDGILYTKDKKNWLLIQNQKIRNICYAI